MTSLLLLLRRCCQYRAWLLLWLLALPAHAGNISFNLSLTENRLSLTNQGNSSAFHPVVYRLLGNGKWEALAPAPGVQPPVEMKPNDQFESQWSDRGPVASLPPLEALRPVMVRFFDQAGASFGQISFFNQPLNATGDEKVQAGYDNGRLKISPPKNPDIAATWLVWPQEEGIAPLTAPIELEHHQPDARRIEWRAGMDPVSFDLGKGKPVVFLLHETREGLRLQVVPRGRHQGREQRAAWLSASKPFYFAASLALAAAAALLLWPMLAAWRNRRA